MAPIRSSMEPQDMQIGPSARPCAVRPARAPRRPARTAIAAALLALSAACTAETAPPAATGAAAVAASANALDIVCTELHDSDRTRLVLEVGRAHTARRPDIVRFEIVTPEFLWPTPGQPETPRLPTELSDASPNLAAALRFGAAHDSDGELRLLDFHAREPDAVALEGLRGSLALHESWQNRRALASLFYAATGNLVQLVALDCRRFGGD